MSKFPSFPDLGKDCRDLFSKGYHIGLFKINTKNETCHGVEVKTTGSHKMEDKSATAEVELKAPVPVCGLSLSCVTKWDIENNLTEELISQDIIPGAKITLLGKMNPDSGNKGGGLKAQYKHRRLTLDANVNKTDDSVLAGGSIVTGYKGLMAAYKVDYDTAKGELTANNIGLAYNALDYSLLLAFENLSLLNGFYFHRVSSNIDIGVQTKILGGEEGAQLSIGGKYTFSGFGHTLRAKVDNKSKFGLGLELKIQQAFSAFASADVDLKNIASGGHKIGFGLEFGC